MVFRQQDAFDEVDASSPIDRQMFAFTKVYDLVTRSYNFTTKEQVRDYFTRLTGLFRNFNYAAANSPDYGRLVSSIDKLAEQAA